MVVRLVVCVIEPAPETTAPPVWSAKVRVGESSSAEAAKAAPLLLSNRLPERLLPWPFVASETATQAFDT